MAHGSAMAHGATLTHGTAVAHGSARLAVEVLLLLVLMVVLHAGGRLGAGPKTRRRRRWPSARHEAGPAGA